MNFLVVDDDPAILKLVQGLLQLDNHQVTLSESALHAIQLIAQGSFDILLTDATMPQHSGFDLVRSLKKREIGQNLTIAMLTGRSEKSDIEQALELGVQDYIIKPIEPQLFLDKVNKLIERHKRKSGEATFEAPAPKAIAAELQHTVEVVQITDLGVRIRTPHPLTKGLQVHITITELKKAGISQSRFKVIFNSYDNSQNICELLLLDMGTRERETLSQLAKKWGPQQAA